MFKKPTDNPVRAVRLDKTKGGSENVQGRSDVDRENAEDIATVDVTTPRRPPEEMLPSRAAASQKSQQNLGRKGDPRESHSVVDEWLTMRGDLETEGNLQVKGRVLGNIQCISVICEQGALIDGEIDADEVTVRGTTRGVIRAKIVKLESTAEVESDIFHESFACEQGARIQGRLSFRDDGEAAAGLREAKSVRPSPRAASEVGMNGQSRGHE